MALASPGSRVIDGSSVSAEIFAARLLIRDAISGNNT
jgi:hypothetical protein